MIERPKCVACRRAAEHVCILCHRPVCKAHKFHETHGHQVETQQAEASGVASLPTSEQLSGKACRVCGHYFDDFEPSFEWCCAPCELRQASGEIPRLPIVREWLHQDLASEAPGDA